MHLQKRSYCSKPVKGCWQVQLKLLGWCRFGLTWSVPAGSAVSSLTDYYLDTIDALYAVSANLPTSSVARDCAGSVPMPQTLTEPLSPRLLHVSGLAAYTVS